MKSLYGDRTKGCDRFHFTILIKILKKDSVPASVMCPLLPSPKYQFWQERRGGRIRGVSSPAFAKIPVLAGKKRRARSGKDSQREKRKEKERTHQREAA